MKVVSHFSEKTLAILARLATACVIICCLLKDHPRRCLLPVLKNSVIVFIPVVYACISMASISGNRAFNLWILLAQRSRNAKTSASEW